MRKGKDDVPEVQSITSAPEARSDSMGRRQKVYVIQMSARLVLFILTVLTWDHVPLWASLTIAAGAVVLPYTAVLLANEPRTTRGSATQVPRPEIGPSNPPHLPGGST